MPQSSLKKDTLLSIGVGENQLPLIRAANDAGWRVVGLDRELHPEAAPYLSGWIECSTWESESARRAVEAWPERERFAALLVRSSGPAIRTASLLSQQIGDAPIPVSFAEAVVSKSSLREQTAQFDFRLPDSISGERFPDAATLPCIIKPDQPSRGKAHVYRLDAADSELFEACRQASLNGRVEITPWLDGIDVGVILQRGPRTSDHLVFDEWVGLEGQSIQGLGVAWPSLIAGSELETQLVLACQQLSEYWGLGCGTWVFSFRVISREHFILYEVNMGLCGDAIVDGLLGRVMPSWHPYERELAMALGEEPQMPQPTESAAVLQGEVLDLKRAEEKLCKLPAAAEFLERRNRTMEKLKAQSLRRSCVICGGETELLTCDDWRLPGIGTHSIGISACRQCSAVIQSPTVHQETMLDFYQHLAVYTNPGRAGKPAAGKVRDVNEQLAFIERELGRLPASCLQVGSSDGYTLSRFEAAGVARVLGLDVGEESAALAMEQYGIQTELNTLESFETDERFELIVLSHVLEHLYQPAEALQRCAKLQAGVTNPHMYIEIPLFTEPALLPPGFFSFEHINHFTEVDIRRLVTQNGYQVVASVVHTDSNLAPIIGLLTRPSTTPAVARFPASNARELAQAYLEQERGTWSQIGEKVKSQVAAGTRCYVWGCGVHTTQLFAFTDLDQHLDVVSLLDSSSLKWGVKLGDWTCQDPKQVQWQVGDVLLISSYASEEEIFRSTEPLRASGVRVLRLYH